MNEKDIPSDDDDASSSSSSFSKDDDDASSSTDSDDVTKYPPDGRLSAASGLTSMMADWLGDDRDAMKFHNDNNNEIIKDDKSTPPASGGKKKLVPLAVALSSMPTTSRRRQRCYLVRGTDSAGSLVEQYSESEPVNGGVLAHWTPPADRTIPTSKFARNWGRANLADSIQPGDDVRGRRAHFAQVCRWLAEAKAYDASVTLRDPVSGWDFDVYLYSSGTNNDDDDDDDDRDNDNENDEEKDGDENFGGLRTVVLAPGRDFRLSDADAVAVVPRGSDFPPYHDPHSDVGIEKWVDEGGKLGFATRLDVRAGIEYAEQRGGTGLSGSGGVRGGGTMLQRQSMVVTEEDGAPESSSLSPSSDMPIGTPVYVRDAHYSWIPATVESQEDDKGRMKVAIRLPPDWEEGTVVPDGGGRGGGSRNSLKTDRLVKLSDYWNGRLPLQNLDNRRRGVVHDKGKDDMADLANLHEAAILYNLKARNAASLPYTRVGDILVAMNPFTWIEGLYSEERQDFYAKNLIWDAHHHGDNLISPRRGSNHGLDTVRVLATPSSERRAVGYEYEKLGIHPHVYETSSLAYLGLAVGGNDQTILVTGESGAGKTETIKIVMNHLATVERSRPAWPESDRAASSDHGSDTVTRVLQANPLFEAFGNAKTLRNDNSSRFGKFTQLQFNVEAVADAESEGRKVPSCHLAGSRCITYLLEKSRVVSVSEGERTFHIFYQLLGAPEEDKRKIWEEGLVGTSMSDFAYLSNTSPNCIEGLDSPENWPATVAALSVFGIQGDMFLNVMRSLCVILQLGNITFDAEMQDGTERSIISSTDQLGKLSSLMGVSAAEIEGALTKRFMNTRGEEFTIFLKPNEARDGCDALAKEIYARVFDLLVTKCNESTEPGGSPTNEYGTISLLDIFGFESFKVNHFEQLCINYANERLQQKYVVDNFQAIQHEYEAEGVNVFDFSLIDNTDVINLFEAKLGLITQLNEECMKKGVGGDESFVYKFKVVNFDSNRMIQDHLHRPYEFGIRHYAAPIKYDARRFIEKNLDKIPPDLLNCACQSTNPLIRNEFLRYVESIAPKSKGPSMRSEATKHFVFTKFKHQLTSLMSLIENSRTRYIRCVKPNKEMSPKRMDLSHTAHQLESAGLVTAIAIARESFPNKLPYELLMERFRFLQYKLGPSCRLDSGNIKVDAETLLNHLLSGMTADTHQGKVKTFACGKTRVYFRAGALESIETTRQEYYAESAIILQTWIRVLPLRQRFLTLKRGVSLLQSGVRSYFVRKRFSGKVQSIVTLQCFIRKFLLEKELVRRRKERVSTALQASWRGKKPRQKYLAIRKAAIRIQSLSRMIAGKKVVAIKKKERNEAVAVDMRMSVMQQTFDDAGSVQGSVFSVDEGLLNEVETMFDFLRKEIVILRKKNIKLKKDIAEAETDKRDMFKHTSNLDHSLAVAKIQNEQISKTNATLLEDDIKRRKEVSKLKNELRMQQEAHEEQLQEMKSEFEKSLKNRALEIFNLAQNLEASTAAHKREVQKVRDEAERKQEEQFSQISRLREEIMNTQNSHQDYLSKLMDVLETTQESRRSVLASDERKKEGEIAELREEVARLRQRPGAGGANGNDSLKKDTIKSMKYIIKKNREQRKSRVQHLGALTDQLEASLASGDLSEAGKLIISMKDTFQKGEKLNSKMDREMVNMLDNPASYGQGLGGAPAADTATLVAENKKLRRTLEKLQKRDIS